MSTPYSLSNILLYQIFGLLEPIDLLHLSRTNRAFREVLSSKNATSVWKTVRVHRGGVPDCMPGMSEVQWASLLFGGRRCHVCSVSDFIFTLPLTLILGVWHVWNPANRLWHQA
jgi:hypothetical protein